MQSLTVLYDAGCPVCTRFRDWLLAQPAHLTLYAVPAGSEQARRRWPELDRSATLREVTVLADTGEIWTGPQAWVVLLWATRQHRLLAERLATPGGLPVARAMAYAAAGLRSAVAGAGGADGYADDCDRSCAPLGQG